MWNRIKRVITSHIDDLTNRMSSPDKDVRAITRAEIARLNEMEVQARASAKMAEKELAQLELKMIGAAQREKLARERGDQAALSQAANDLVFVSQQMDILKKQIIEANASADRARSLREVRAGEGNELANETYLTAMKESLAGIQSPFDATDPSGTIEEMRSRIRGATVDDTALRVAEADREMEAARARERADDLLAKYKSGLKGETETPAPDPPSQSASPSNQVDPHDEPQQPKTLGPGDGPVRPID
jgi:hypothetical protein